MPQGLRRAFHFIPELLVLAAVLSMVGCSSEESEEQSRPRPRSSKNPEQNFVICRTDLGDVRVNDLRWSKAALTALRQLQVAPYLEPLEQLSQQPALTHTLLLRSAEQAGFKPLLERARELLNQAYPQWQKEQKTGDFPLDRFVAEYLAVMDFLQSQSSPEDEQEARRQARQQMLTRVTGRRIAFPAEAWAKQTPKPTQGQIHRTFDQYRDVPPRRPEQETNPYGLGYRAADRVAVEYLIVDTAELAASIEPDPEELANYYAQHKDRFVPAGADGPLDLPEVIGEVRRDLQAALARRRMQQCIERIRNHLRDRAGQGQSVPFEQIEQQVRLELGSECMETGSTGLCSKAQLQQRPQLGRAFVLGGPGAEPNVLPARLFEQAREMEPEPHLGGELSGPALIGGSKLLFWRITEFEPSHSPKELTPEIARQVAWDLQTIAAMDIVAEELKKLESEEALEEFIEDYGSIVPLDREPLHDLWLLENDLPVIVGRRIFWATERTRQYLPLREALADYVRSHPAEASGKLIVRLPARREVCLVQIEKIHYEQKDLSDPEVESAYRYLRFLEQVRILRTWLDDETLHRRVNLQFVE